MKILFSFGLLFETQKHKEGINSNDWLLCDHETFIFLSILFARRFLRLNSNELKKL